MWVTDREAMEEALRLARQAGQAGEVPVGAVAVCDGVVVGRGRNAREEARDPTAHAELLAVQQAARALGRWRLGGVTVFVTLEPCAMCAGAMVLARIDRLVFGASDPKAGAVGSLLDLSADPRLNHRFPVERGLLGEESGELLRAFFRARRGGEAGSPSGGPAGDPSGGSSGG
jgi:tRNA(adenine34) deaminase